MWACKTWLHGPYQASHAFRSWLPDSHSYIRRTSVFSYQFASCYLLLTLLSDQSSPLLIMTPVPPADHTPDILTLCTKRNSSLAPGHSLQYLYIKPVLLALSFIWTKDHLYRMVIVEGCCTMARSSSYRSKLFIGWHKSIVSSDWSDTMVWFGQILLYFNYYHPVYMILG